MRPVCRSVLVAARVAWRPHLRIAMTLSLRGAQGRFRRVAWPWGTSSDGWRATGLWWAPGAPFDAVTRLCGTKAAGDARTIERCAGRQGRDAGGEGEGGRRQGGRLQARYRRRRDRRRYQEPTVLRRVALLHLA